MIERSCTNFQRATLGNGYVMTWYLLGGDTAITMIDRNGKTASLRRAPRDVRDRWQTLDHAIHAFLMGERAWPKPEDITTPEVCG